MDKKAYDLWLYSLLGIGRKTCMKLWEQGYTGEKLYAGDDRCFSMLNEKQKGSLINGRKITKNKIQDTYEKMLQEGIFMTVFGDADYPRQLYQIPDAPAVLFYKGILPKPTQKSIAIIGARNCSNYGIACAKHFAGVFAQNGVAVISGMARGIDGVAQSTAMENGGYSAAVLGSGVQVCYPPEHIRLYHTLSQKGCILSEYLPSEKAAANHFPARNRLISGLADALLVVEAKEKSGTLITVEMALEQGKEVYVVPGRIDDVLSSGCNELLYEGAGIAVSPEKMLEDLYGMKGSSSDNSEEKIYSDMEKKVIDVLESTPLFLDEIQRRTGLSDDVLFPTLLNLMLQHQIKQTTSGWYERA